MKKEVVRSVSLVVGGILVGASTTYLITKSKLEAKYHALAEEEISSVRESYKKLYKTDEYKSPDSTLQELYVEQVDDLGYSAKEAEDVDEEESTDHTPLPETTNIFDHSDNEDPEEDDDVMKWERSFEDPYVITIAEFMEDKQEFDKITINYYDEDNTLSDERDGIINDVERLIGADNLEHFGKGSDNEHTVYIRNERMSTDWEVVRDMRSYATVVFGLDEDDIADTKVPRKMRDRIE